jgi:hypothetical protein
MTQKSSQDVLPDKTCLSEFIRHCFSVENVEEVALCFNKNLKVTANLFVDSPEKTSSHGTPERNVTR